MKPKDPGPRLAFAACLALSTVSCDRGSVGSGLACYPKEARRWLHAETAKVDDSHAATRATIYVDRSGSMVGYIDGATGIERPLQDLVDTLPGTLRESGATAAYRAFGSVITEEIADGRKVLQQSRYYQGESKIDEVLSRIANHPDELAVVVSDLWFKNDEIQTSGLTALQVPLAKILESGRAVSVYGVDAPFDGKIYDLPGSELVSYRGRHPLYMLVIGAKAQVVAFRNALNHSGSKQIATGVASGAIHHALFVTDPAKRDAEANHRLESGSNPLFRAASFPSPKKVDIDHYRMSRTLGAKAIATVAKSPFWEAPRDANFVRDAVWHGPMTGQLQLWAQRDWDCKPGSWGAPNPVAATFDTQADGRMKLLLDPAMLRAGTGTGKTYLLTGTVTRSTVTADSPAARWMRGDWNLEPEKVSEVGTRPARFPTLNLSEFARLMENTLATSVERKREPLDGFAVLIKVED